MIEYPIPMVPGPVRVPEEILNIWNTPYGSADLEPEFARLYTDTEKNLQAIMATRSRVVIQTGEGMLALWSALKSCLKPDDRVLAISTGLFGTDIGNMARAIGAQVKTISLEPDCTLDDPKAVEDVLGEFRPRMITAVHCETPSGTLNPLAELGRLKAEYEVPLLYVDAVSSIGGAPVLTDDWHIDLCLGGSQKCLSVPPCATFLSVSERAWEVIEKVDYPGYEALKPFREAPSSGLFPYTPDWHGVAALKAGAGLILAEGLEACFQRHRQAAERCRHGLKGMGLELFPAPGAVPSPTVTAVRVPDTVAWSDLDAACRRRGLVMGGNYGPLDGKVFRLGHMGSQADLGLIDRALEVLGEVTAGM